MKQKIRRAALAVLAFFLLAYVALLLTVNSAKFQDWMKAEIANRTGYDVSAREIRLDPLLRLTLLEVKAAKALGPALQAERIVVSPGPVALFSRTISRLQLEKPVLSFDIYEVFGGTDKQPMAVSIRQLIIKDGTVVLRTGKGNKVDFRDLSMSAQNVNLGEGIGVRLRTAVPRLDGVVSIAVEGSGAATEAVIQLDQSGGHGSGLIQGDNRRTLEITIKLTRPAGGPIQVSAQGRLDAARFAGGSFSGEVSGSAQFNPELKEATFSASAVATELPIRLTVLPFPLPKGRATLKLRGNYDLAANNLSLASVELKSPLGEATGSGQVSFDPAPTWKQARVTVRKVAVENLKPMLPGPLNAMVFGGTAEADLEIEGQWPALAIAGMTRVSGVKVRHEQMALAEVVLETPVRWSDGSFRAENFRFSGQKLVMQRKGQIEISAETVSVAGIFEQKRDEEMQAAGTLRIQRAAFASTDGSKMGQNLALEARVDSLRLGAGDGVSLACKLEIMRGELLWGKFYGDVKTQRPTLEIAGEYHRNVDRLRLRRADLALAPVGQVMIRGDVENILTRPVTRLEITGDGIQSAGFFEFFIRETFNRSYPILDRLAVAGILSVSAKASGPLGEPIVEGTITLRRGALRAKSDDWNLAGIEIALPFLVSYPAATPKAMPGRVSTGRLSIESARFGTEIIPRIATTLSLRNNELRFDQPIRVPIYGGSLVLSNLAWKDVIATPQALLLSLEAKNLQLRQLTEALDWHRFGGTLSGSIPNIELTGGSLRSQGQIDIAVFGGRLRMNQLEIENPFSALAAVKLNARFQDIQLEQASETFAFGQISGVLAGTVNNLVVRAGQPSSFDADIYSVEKSGVGQRISVESLNKITVLSSGQEAGALYGGLAGFFDSFRYSKLGFKVVLKNDKLTLRGVESQDGKEYLVVGSLIPPTVNVISHTQEIAFLELLRRLERIQKSGAPQKAGGP